jgi:hypothetical protein
MRSLFKSCRATTDIDNMSIRDRLPVLLDIVVATVMMAIVYRMALHVGVWEDFFTESAPAVRHLIHGDLPGFLSLVPAYGGSLLVQAPFTLIGGTLGGLSEAYRAGALFCLAVMASLALMLAKSARSMGLSALVSLMLITLLVANPIAIWAIKEGHPEEILTAAFCVGGLLLVIHGRLSTGALLLGLAVACKQWAILAIPLGLVVARGHRVRFSMITTGSAAALFTPILIAGPTNFVVANKALTSAPYSFGPQQIWQTLGLFYMRPLGGPKSKIYGPSAVHVVASYSHPFIVVVAVLLGVAFWLRRGHVEPMDALLLLALILLLRCLLDPWNVIYYQYPFLVALASWETFGARRAPWLTVAASFLAWTSFREVSVVCSRDVTNLFYLMWTLPAATTLLWRSLRLRPPRFLGAEITARGAQFSDLAASTSKLST